MSSPPSAESVAKQARSAYEASQLIDSKERDVALQRIRDILEQNKSAVLEANQKDLDVRQPLSHFPPGLSISRTYVCSLLNSLLLPLGSETPCRVWQALLLALLPTLPPILFQVRRSPSRHLRRHLPPLPDRQGHLCP
jgi:hypothetical protein